MGEIKEEKELKLKLIYDIQTIPNGATIQDVVNVMVSAGVVLWDSAQGVAPKFIDEEAYMKDLRFKLVNAIDLDDPQD